MQDINCFRIKINSHILTRKNANTPVVKAHAQISQKVGNIYVGKYSPAQLIKKVQPKAVIKYFYSFSNNHQKKNYNILC